jgi:peptidoglycan/xylan/chitin deacetylase (PgdA/CDA1 family)
MSVLRNVKEWSRGRDPRWIARRGLAIVGHYGLSGKRAKGRVLDCVALLARYDARPMFATPGRVVDAEQRFFRELADDGVELAPHGYDHVDFRRLGTDRAREEFERACDAYDRAGVWFRGFRCPYLSFDETVAPALPPGRFAYSSNVAIRWDHPETPGDDDPIARQLATFYDAVPAERVVSRPRLSGGIVEIPASLPDDFELTIARRAGADVVAAAWNDVHERVIARGELFAPLFHPEAYDHCATAFEQMLDRARRSGGEIWTPRLADVADWWLERAGATVDVTERDGDVQVDVEASPRVTVLVRGLAGTEGAERWDDAWVVLEGRSCRFAGPVRPVVGLGPDVPAETAAILREEGFVVETETRNCAVVLERSSGIDLEDEVALVRHVESAPGPLVRIWRWPGRARSAVTVAGDLDALSIRDYLARFRAR